MCQHMVEVALIAAYANTFGYLGCRVTWLHIFVSYPKKTHKFYYWCFLQIFTALFFAIKKVLYKRFPNGIPNPCLRNKYKSAKVIPGGVNHIRGTSPRDPIRWWHEDEGKEENDVNFNEHESVLHAANMIIRKGKKL